MVLRMTRPITRKGTVNASFRKRIPADVKRILDALPSRYRPEGWGKKGEIVISLRTSDRRTIPGEHARIAAEVEERFRSLRSGVQALSHKQAVALAGEAYRELARLEEEPGNADNWWRALLANMKAQAGPSWSPLDHRRRAPPTRSYGTSFRSVCRCLSRAPRRRDKYGKPIEVCRSAR